MSAQPGLFDVPAAVHLPPPKITVRRRKAIADGQAAGADLAEQGALRAIDKAGDLFKEAALRFFVTYAMTAERPVGIAEARLASGGAVPVPKEGRAWGHIPTLAKKRGFVEHAGFAASSDPKSHSSPMSVWRWTGKTL